MKFNSDALGVFIGVIVFMIGSSGITIGHYATDGWELWYGVMAIASFLLGFAASVIKE